MRIALALGALALAGQAQAAGEEYRSCAIKAYGIDQDVKGMNVRAALCETGMMRIALALGSLALAGQAQAAGEEYRSCAIKAYGIDQDVKGMNVRAAPSAKARIVRNVSNYVAGETTITGYRAGWFRVSKVLTAEEDTVLFRGDGWVHASLLHLDVASGDPTLYSAPSRKARVLKKLTGDQPGVTLVSCSGDWAQVRVNGVLGWLSPGGQCSNPLTTCA